MSDKNLTVGIEVGGTFTDLVLLEGQEALTHKVPSTPSDPSQGALRGLDEILELAGRKASQVETLLHGSTIAANALLQRRGAPTAFITTRGFRDILFTQRADRTTIYGLTYRKPKPLVRREHCLEVDERLAANGEVVVPLDARDLLQRLEILVERDGIESVAICLLHSYVNPEHEQELASLILARHPGIRVTTSSEIAPEHREYERASTTTINAYLSPVISSYLSRFEQGVRDRGYTGTPLIMQSSGGVVPIQLAGSVAAGMFLSGPSAAATGATVVARALHNANVISLDVGGTSSDVCLIAEGMAHTTLKGTAEFSVDGLPLSLMMTDIVTIGAGGGSIASLTPAGLLDVGPQSAGAVPGPACYGRGGDRFTLSDAMLLLGLLDATEPLPGGIQLDAARSTAAASELSAALRLKPSELADRTYRIVTSKMAQAIRRISVKRGYDPREYALLPCGGVGGLVACAVAEELGIARIVVPHHPGIFSAFGLCKADLRMDYIQAISALRCDALTPDRLRYDLGALAQRAVQDFQRIGHDPQDVRLAFSADARYAGQGYEVRVEIDRDTVSVDAGKPIADSFHDAHQRQYGKSFPQHGVELMALRLTATLTRDHSLLTYAPGTTGHARRAVRLGGEVVDYEVLDRASLPVGYIGDGPLLLAETTTTSLVAPGWRCQVLDNGLVEMSRRS